MLRTRSSHGLYSLGKSPMKHCFRERSGKRGSAFVGRFVASATIVFLVTLPARGDERAFKIPVGQRQLFLDDHVIGRLDNVVRTMHRPEKRGAVIRSPNPLQSLQTRAAPVWDNESQFLKFWVLGIDDTLWQSRDGLHWVPGPKPDLKPHLVVYDPRDKDPDRRFKAVLTSEGFAVSPDGAHWTKLKTAAIPSADEGNLSYDPLEGLFIHSAKRYPKGPRGVQPPRCVAIAVSRDFRNWTDYGIVFQADDQDQQLGKERIAARFATPTLEQPAYNDPAAYAVDVYNMGVFHYEGQYIGMPAIYHATAPIPNYPNTEGFHIIELACSRDLKAWKRLGDRLAFIGPSLLDSGAYDLTQVLPPSAPLVKEDELWFYYTGLKYRTSWTYVGKYPKGKEVYMPGKEKDAGAVCLAVLRRDGFISLDAVQQQGIVETKSFDLEGTKLHVNVEAAKGQIEVEAVGRDGKAVATSEPIVGDQPRAAVRWKSGGLADRKGKAIRLRFKFKNASLYSFWFEI